LVLIAAVIVKVTIVASGNRLLEFLGPKASEKAFKWLQKKKVEVIYNDKYALVTRK
jgi:NADH dehydrogenase FAD-containing subunit